MFNLFPRCIVYENLENYAPHNVFEKASEIFGSEEWVRLYCAMCAKFLYARSKNQIKVVNTL